MTRTYLNQFSITEDTPLFIPEFLLDASIWVDESWHNETAPRFTNNELMVSVWVDFDKSIDREMDDAKKYTVCRINEEGNIEDDDIFASDDWDETLIFLADLFIIKTFKEIDERTDYLLTLVRGIPFGTPGRGKREAHLELLQKHIKHLQSELVC